MTYLSLLCHQPIVVCDAECVAKLLVLSSKLNSEVWGVCKRLPCILAKGL